MTRAESHTKETIACRAFEYALHPNFVIQASRQGSDYGIDYFVQAFSQSGQLERQFGVQVKYIPEESIQQNSADNPFTYEGGVIVHDYQSPLTTKVRIRKGQLRDWLDKSKTPADVVLVAANETAIFFVWIDDLADLYLNWIPGAIEGTGTVTLLLSGVRCIQPSVQPIPHSYTTTSRGWFGISCLRDTTDSIVNISSVSLLHSVNSRTTLGDSCATEKYFDHIRKRTSKCPLALPRFARFLRNQPSSKQLGGWAIETLKAWSNAYEVPAALYLLSSCGSRRLCAEGLSFLNTVERPHHYLSSYRDLVPRTLEFDAHIEYEYLNSVACFLYIAATEHELEDAQECLVKAFFQFDYSLPMGNIYSQWLSYGARTKRLLPGKSFDSLMRMCGVVCPEIGTNLALAIQAVSTKWAYEERESK